MHFNENSNRKQAVTKEGEHRYRIVYPKYKKGGYVVKKVVEAPTYGESLVNNLIMVINYAPFSS